MSPLLSTATAMNYANPLLFVQSTMTQGCEQLTPGMTIKKNKKEGKKPSDLPESKRIIVTAVPPAKSLLNTAGVTTEVIRESRTRGRSERGHPPQLSQCHASCGVKLAKECLH